MRIEEFDYKLPKELIAQYPSVKRDESRLLVVHRRTQKIEHRQFYNIVEYFQPGDVLILNETKVIPARLIGRRKDTGGKVEVFLLKPIQQNEWEVMISPQRAAKVGMKIEFGEVQPPDEFWGEVTRIAPRGTTSNCASQGTPATAGSRRKRDRTYPFYCIFRFNCEVNSLLEKKGQVPLPPYIKRAPLPVDIERYQTVYARVPGACAAPTAGLHFTQNLLQEIENKGIEIAKIVLQVGIGTFKPIKSEKVEEHKMESEYFEISEAMAQKINQAKRRIAVGTTTVRALESEVRPQSDSPIIKPTKAWTEKFIYPNYEFKVVDALVTNFHLPKSTLLLLVCAFAGRELIFKAYAEAIKDGYKFYSYGDAMLII
ncbi:MAG: tRNA preQ1(34) S-adenosylmethionine ribosyltransferase-isomerase QueA [Candidatus Stahlbacteria bacterium]|nr:tRNA preQ1(34) S-adenosylmethionine ribosyltransferase-isomerase QueA [Candidatus Stahlbacteria bacterium]